MRALTVQQPWAWAIIHGGKTVENRTRNLAGSYRGPVAIHAGLTFDDHGGRDRNILRHEAYADAPMTKGAVIGVVDLVDVHTAEDELLVNGLGTPACCQSPWAEYEHTEIRRLCDTTPTRISDRVHLVLENPRALKGPIFIRGRLGLWTPPEAVVDEIDQQLHPRRPRRTR